MPAVVRVCYPVTDFAKANNFDLAFATKAVNAGAYLSEKRQFALLPEGVFWDAKFEAVEPAMAFIANNNGAFKGNEMRLVRRN